jgi:hypothetical protein
MFTCGLVRSNFSFAICPHPHAQANFRNRPGQTLERGTGFEPATITLEE